MLHVHVHVTYAGSRSAWEMLAFRDHLREHPEDAERYLRLKHECSSQAGANATRYTELKSGFIREILERAERHAGGCRASSEPDAHS